MAKELQISDADKLIIEAIKQTKTIPELHAFQVDGRSKAVEDAIVAHGVLLLTTERRDDELGEDHTSPRTIVAPYAYYDDDEALHSWQPGVKLSMEDAAFLEERGVELVNWISYNKE